MSHTFSFVVLWVVTQCFDHRTQCNDNVFVTCLSLLFSVASFSGETVRGDAAVDIAKETVSLHGVSETVGTWWPYSTVRPGANI